MPLTTIYGDGNGTRIINTTLGNSGIIQTLHPDVMQFVRTLATAGTPYQMTVQEIDAVNELVLGLVANGLWSKMQVVYPFIGSNSTAQSYNLKNTSTFQITWVGTAFTTSTSNGWQKTTTALTSYGNTTYNPNTSATANSVHISTYVAVSQSGTIVVAGAFSNSPSNRWVQINNSTPSGNVAIQDQFASFTTPSPNTGFILGTRTSSTSLRTFYNNSLLATQSVAATNVFPNFSIFLGGQNNVGALAFPCTQAIRFFSVGTGLTDDEARAFNSVVSIYQQKLGRNV